MHPEYQSCAAVVTRVDASAECFGAREAKVIFLFFAHVVFILLPFWGCGVKTKEKGYGIISLFFRGGYSHCIIT